MQDGSLEGGANAPGATTIQVHMKGGGGFYITNVVTVANSQLQAYLDKHERRINGQKGVSCADGFDTHESFVEAGSTFVRLPVGIGLMSTPLGVRKK